MLWVWGVFSSAIMCSLCRPENPIEAMASVEEGDQPGVPRRRGRRDRAANLSRTARRERDLDGAIAARLRCRPLPGRATLGIDRGQMVGLRRYAVSAAMRQNALEPSKKK